MVHQIMHQVVRPRTPAASWSPAHHPGDGIHTFPHRSLLISPQFLTLLYQVYNFNVPTFGPGVVYDVDQKVRTEQFRFFTEALKKERLKKYVPQFVMEAEVSGGWGRNDSGVGVGAGGRRQSAGRTAGGEGLGGWRRWGRAGAGREMASGCGQGRGVW